MLVRVFSLVIILSMAVGCLSKKHPIVSGDEFAPPVVYVEGAQLPTHESDVPAAQLGEHVILGKNSDGIQIGEGRGLLVDAVVESDILGDGNFVRLAQAAAIAKAKWAIGVSPTSGLMIERETGRASAYGNGPVIILDLIDADFHEKPRTYRNIRANIIWPGDTWSFFDRNIRFVPQQPTGRDIPTPDQNDTIRIIDALTRRSMASEPCSFKSDTPTHQLILRREEGTMILSGDFAPGQEVRQYPSFSKARLDLVPVQQNLQNIVPMTFH